MAEMDRGSFCLFELDTLFSLHYSSDYEKILYTLKNAK